MWQLTDIAGMLSSKKPNLLLTDWFAQKNLDDTVIFSKNIYYWYESGSFDY